MNIISLEKIFYGEGSFSIPWYKNEANAYCRDTSWENHGIEKLLPWDI